MEKLKSKYDDLLKAYKEIIESNNMKVLSVVLFLSMMITNIKAGEPLPKKFNYGGFFAGLAAGYALPVFVAGSLFACHAKAELRSGAISRHYRRLLKGDIFLGRTIQGVGIGMILIPLLVNNRQLLMDKISKS